MSGRRMDVAQQAVGRDLICVVDANPSYQSDVAKALTAHYRVSTFAEQNAALEAIYDNGKLVWP